MAKHNDPYERDIARIVGSGKMEEREGTAEEVASALGNAPLAPLPPHDPTRDDDYVDPTREARKAALQASAPVAEPSLKDVYDRLGEVSEKGSDSPTLAAAMVMLAQTLQGMKEATLQGAQLQADMQRRTVAPENRFVPMVSEFNPRGEKDFPRPQLKCQMFIPWPAEAESLTREEIEYLNLLEEGEYTVRLVDRRPIRLRVLMERRLDSDEPSKLSITHGTAFNNDNQSLIPFDWLRQMVVNNPKTRDRALAVVTIEQEEEFIKAGKFNDGRLANKGEQLVSVGA